jgi:hypothetical protein
VFFSFSTSTEMQRLEESWGREDSRAEEDAQWCARVASEGKNQVKIGFVDPKICFIQP